VSGKGRKAANEAVFREVNERIEELQRRFSVAGDELLQIVCECDELNCMTHISVSVGTYERVRGDSATFLVAPGHEDPSVEEVLERDDGYFVVRKRAGEARRIAEASDPR